MKNVKCSLGVEQDIHEQQHDTSHLKDDGVGHELLLI